MKLSRGILLISAACIGVMLVHAQSDATDDPNKPDGDDAKASSPATDDANTESSSPADSSDTSSSSTTESVKASSDSSSSSSSTSTTTSTTTTTTTSTTTTAASTTEQSTTTLAPEIKLTTAKSNTDSSYEIIEETVYYLPGYRLRPRPPVYYNYFK